MFAKIGNFAVKHRWWMIAGWIVVAALMFFLAPSLSQVGTMSESTFLPEDSESLRARELINQHFPESQSASTASLIFYNPQGLTEGDISYARQVNAWLSSGSKPFKVTNITSIFENPELETRLVSPDKTTMIMNAGLEKVAFESESWKISKDIRDYLKSAPQGLEVYVSGQVGIYSDLFDSINRSVTLTSLITIILVIVLLIVIYRSPIAALVPLITIGLAYLIARGIMGIIGNAGVSIWSQIDIFLIVMIFGIGTDYCLFLISRFREERQNKDIREAMKFSVGKIGSVISASAFAVIVGLAGMAVARYQMIQTIGPLLGIAIFITLLAALTLAPALASIFGHRLFWPRHNSFAKTSNAANRRGFWEKVAGISTGKPAIVAGIVIVLMLIPYLALPGLNRSFDQLSEIPSDSESIVGYNILKEHYDIGEIDPLTMIIVAPQGQTLTSPAALKDLSEISKDLNSVNSILKVQSIVQPDGNGKTPEGLTVSGQLVSIGEGITSSFASSSSDPALLFSDDVSNAFTQLNGYFGELEHNFTWIKQESSYQQVQSSLQSMQQIIQAVKTEAMVENQLISISQQVDQIGQVLTAPGATLTPQMADSITLVKAYLDELAEQYPSVKAEKSYQSLYTSLEGIQSAMAQMQTLPPEKLQALMSMAPAYMQQIKADLNELAQTFKGTGSILLSSSLSQALPATSPADELKAQFFIFNENLLLLSQAFAQNDNPVFLSTTLMETSSEFQGLMRAFFCDSNQATRLYLVLDSYPQSDAALTAVAEARKAIKSSIEDTSLKGAEVVIGGTSAELADVRQILDEDFIRIIIVVLVAIFVVLALLLRSLIAPVYLLLTVLLSYGTTLGIVTWIFQGIMGQEGISFLIPILVFVLLIALGSDYNIFLMSRVREESLAQNTRLGARLAATATGGVITACGIILAGTFAALIITPIRTLMQIGVSISIGILIDTFIVRALLVPAIASLLGRWNWWPQKQGKTVFALPGQKEKEGLG